MGNSICFRKPSTGEQRNNLYQFVPKNAKSAETARVNFFHEDSITCLSKTHIDNESFFSGSEDRSIVHFNWKTRKVVGKYTGGHTKGIVSVDFSERSQLLISGGRDRSIQVYDLGDSKPRFGVNLHKLSVTTISFHPTHPNFFLSGSRDCTLSIYDLQKQKLVQSAFKTRNLITDFCFFPQSPNFVQTGESMKIRIWDSRNLEVVQEISDEKTLKHILLSCDVSTTNENQFLVSSKGYGSDGCYARIYDLRKVSKNVYYEMKGHQQSVVCARYFGDSYPCQVCTISNDVKFRIFDSMFEQVNDDDDDEIKKKKKNFVGQPQQEMKSVSLEEFGVTPNCLSVSKDRNYAYISGYPEYVCIYDLRQEICNNNFEDGVHVSVELEIFCKGGEE